jgi:competence protein ComEA
MPSITYFSRSQTGVIVLLAAALFFLYAWRADFWRVPSPSAAPTQTLVFIEVTGAVPRPGVHAFSNPPTLLEALAKAGGPPIAIPANPTLASGGRVEIDKAGRYRLSRMAGPQLLTLGLAINLNEASQTDLEALPGVGPVLAGRIIAYRASHGPFRLLEDLSNIPGIGPKNLEQLRPYLALESPKP